MKTRTRIRTWNVLKLLPVNLHRMSTRMNHNRPVICRVCMGLTAPEAAFDIFALKIAGAGCSLAEQLALVGAIDVRPDELDLPQWCCYRCQPDVATAYRVRILCQESDRKLREALAKEAETTVDADEVVCKIEVKEAVIGSTGCEENKMLVLEIYDKTWKEPMIESPGCDKVDEAKIDCNEDDEPELSNQESEIFEEIPVADHHCCCSCRTVFNNLEELLEHTKREHAVEDPPKDTKTMKLCEICYKLKSKSHFAKHTRRRLPKTLFQCKTCAALFLSTNTAYAHYLSDHYTTNKCCGANCKGVFDSVEALQQHSKQVHLPEKGPPDPKRPAECPICFKAFIIYSHLHDHRTRQNKYKCSKCQKDFLGRAALKRHEITTHQEKVCQFCSKVYRDHAEYQRHMLVHRDSIFHCEPCVKIYKNRRDLIHHNIKFHGIRGPHGCDLCPASFARQCKLLAHKLKYHGSKINQRNQESTMEAEESGLVSKVEVEEPKLSRVQESEEEDTDEDEY